jgi:hypothetical protein
MAYQKSFTSRSLQEEEEEAYPSAQNSFHQNHLLGGNDSVHMSTVAGTFPDKPRQGYWNVGMPSNELQLSFVGGTPRWQFTSSAAAGHTNVPSQPVIKVIII